MLRVYPLTFLESSDVHDIVAQGTFIHFSVYERNNTKSSDIIDHIYLYLPEKITIPSTVQWEMKSIGAAGNAIKATQDAANNGGNIFNTFAEKVGKGVAVEGAWGAGKHVLDGLFNSVGAGRYSAESENLLGLAIGSIPNPYMTMLFKGVNVREFEFTFVFYPHNEVEAIVIHDIIKALREHSLPPGGGSGGPPMTLGYPREFEIEFTILGITHPWLNRFKRSVITKLDVNFTGQNMWSVSTQTQYPTYIQLSITFSELSTVLRGDVAEGY